MARGPPLAPGSRQRGPWLPQHLQRDEASYPALPCPPHPKQHFPWHHKPQSRCMTVGCRAFIQGYASIAAGLHCTSKGDARIGHGAPDPHTSHATVCGILSTQGSSMPPRVCSAYFLTPPTSNLLLCIPALSAYRGTNTGAIWSVHCCPSNGLVAYAGEAGIVAIFKERMLQDNRMRKAHTAVAGMRASHLLLHGNW